MTLRATVRVLVIHLDNMLIDVIAVRMMSVAIVQVIDVVALFCGRVTAARPVLLRMGRMGAMR